MRTVELYAAVRRAVFVEGISQREAARRFGLSRTTVAKMMQFSLPPGYRRQHPPRRPKLEPYLGIIDHVLEQDAHSQGSKGILPGVCSSVCAKSMAIP